MPAAVLSLRCGTAAPTAAALEEGCVCAFPVAAAAAAAAVAVLRAQTHFMSPGQRVGSARGQAKAAFLLAVAELKQPGGVVAAFAGRTQETGAQERMQSVGVADSLVCTGKQLLSKQNPW